MNNATYIVYMHIAPNNKKYIGITKNSLNQRCGKNGYNYKTQPKFYNAIQKYGWNNFKHQILFENLSFEDACNKERELILFYDTLNTGYNSDSGWKGLTGHIVSAKSKQIMRNKKLGKKFDTPILKPSRTSIYLYDIEKNFYGKFIGYKAVSDFLGIPRSSIINCCNAQIVYNNKYIFLKKMTSWL